MINNPTNTRQEGIGDQGKENNSCTWGDNIIGKSKDSIRIAFQNINGFVTNNSNHKAELTREFIVKHNVDVLTLAEMNANWRIITKNMQLQQLCKGWHEHQHITKSYNYRDRSCHKYQPGGTAIICREEMGLRWLKSEGDDKGLGRWSSMLFRGKNQLRLRVISVYVPTVSQEYGTKKTFHQQQKALLSMGITKNAMTVFWEDLWSIIDGYLDKGEKLVIAGDWNCDVTSDQFLSSFQLRNLIPGITHIHDPNIAPPTFSRGSKPIDEIFVSSSLTINKCGYLEQGSTLSDHRPIWIDLDKDDAFGSKLPPSMSFKARRLKCNDPRIIKRYNDLLETHLRKHGIYARIADLLPILQDRKITETQLTEFGKINNIVTDGMKKAEHKCRKLKTGNVSWCPKLTIAKKMILYIKSSLSRLRGSKINARTLMKLSKTLKYSTEGLNEDEHKKALNNAFLVYKEIKKSHKQLRETYLEDLASALERDGRGRKASLLRNLITLEQQRETFRRLKVVHKKDSNLGTTFVTVTDSEGQRTDVTDKEQMEAEIIEENKKKYHQTEKTCPFLHEPLVSDLGHCGDGPKVNDVINGTYDIPEEVDEYTKDFLRQCKYTGQTTTLPRTPLEYKQSWEKMKERTSSSYPHFGHYKAVCKHNLNLMTIYTLAEIPFRTGISPATWKKASNVMILKKAGLYDVDKLRTIVLYQSAFNHNNKYLGKEMVNHTIKNNLLAPEQYSRPGRKAIDQALNRRLLFDISRYQKTSIAITSCDLKSNYDRITHTPAILAAMGFGIDANPLKSMFTSIQNTQFTTRTAFGESTRTFGGLEDDFIAKPQGMGQGNGAGPGMWTIVSSKMFHVLRDRGLTTPIIAPISKSTANLSGFAYVDDTDIIAAAGHQNDPDATIRKMQETINCWEGLAKSTGGALDPTKSWWYVLFFKWKKGQWTYGTMGELIIEDSLFIKDKDNVRVELKYMEANEAMEMLGVSLAPDGNNTAQIKKMKDKALKMGESIRSGYVTKAEAWISLNTMALKSLEYPLPALTLSETECTSIMWPVLKQFLPKSGINRTIKRDVLYGPSSAQGLQITNLYLSQGISHISDILEHRWKNTVTGSFITTCLELMKLELGINGPMFKKDINKYEKILLTDSWTKHTWVFASKHKITFDENVDDIPLLRVHDKEIMQALIEAEAPPQKHWKAINRCRIYLQVHSLADITTGNGRYIRRSIVKGNKSMNQGRENIIWPRWERPSPKDWTVWRTFLRSICTDRWLLRQPLGNWTTFDHNNWKWFLSPNNDNLYRRQGNQWSLHKKLGRSRLVHRYNIRSERLVVENDITLLPTTVEEIHGHLHSEGWKECTQQPPTIIPSDALDINALPWLIRSVEKSNNINILLEDITSSYAIAVSDGSYMEHRGMGTAAWTIESRCGTSYIRGTSISPGPPCIQNSYRSELVGLLAIVSQLKLLVQEHNIDTGKCILGCDGLEALRQSSHGHPEWISICNKQSDILSATVKTINTLPIHLSPIHIKGHQDKLTPYQDLDRLARMNIDMDIAAKQELSLLMHHDLSPYYTYNLHPFSFEFPQVDNRPVYHNLKKDLYEAISFPTLANYWVEKGRIPSTSKETICWISQQKANRLSKAGVRRFISKWASGLIACGKNMKRWKLRPYSNCPYCNAQDEDKHHITHCQNTTSIETWEKALSNFVTHLVRLNTCPYLIASIHLELSAERRFKTPPEIIRYPESLRPVILSQRHIGWESFTEGLIAIDMVNYQSQYLRDIKSKKSGKAWAHKMIRASWNMIYSVWEGRNKKLHDTEKIKELEGRKDLEYAIQAEWDIGLHRLPASDFSSLFAGRIQNILDKDMEFLRTWLSIIRNGRYLHKDPALRIDQLLLDPTLRRWLDLCFEVKDGKLIDTVTP